MRIEKDALGELPVPEEAYYGIQTVRCAQNYDVTDHTFNELPHVIRAVAEVKKAAALANKEIKALEAHKADAIAQACDEIIAGKLSDQFPVNIWRSHGTGVNMNVNEVIANRATEILTGRKGYDEVHPNTHVNMCQSSNDTYPAAEAIVLYRMIKKTVESVKYFEDALKEKAIEFKDLPRLGRTCMQDAVPMTFGQVFAAWQSLVQRNRKRLEKLLPEYQETILGATVLGSGMGEMPGYNEAVYKHLSDIVGFEMRQAKNKDEVIEDSALFDGSQNNDSFIYLLGVLKCIACAGGRIGNDLYIFSSGPRTGIGEFILPSIAPGSSIMPGKVNPTQCEAVTMVAVQVMGNDAAMGFAASQGNFELNVFMPVIAYNLIQSIRLLGDVMDSFRSHCVTGIRPNLARIDYNLHQSLILVTGLVPVVGYDKACLIAKKAAKEGLTLREAALQSGWVTAEQFDAHMDPAKLAGVK